MPQVDLGRVVGKDATINGMNIIEIVSGENTDVITDSENKQVKINFLHNVHTFAFQVEVDDWINSEAHPNYAYQVDIEIEGIAENDIGQVIFDAESVITANAAVVLSGGETLENGVRLYSQKKPIYPMAGNILIVEKGWK